MPKLSCVIPVYNEEGNIQELYTRLDTVVKKDFPGFEREFIFIDDGSRDSSVDRVLALRAHDASVKLIQFSRNFGHHVAITAGLDHATGDYVVMMDGDLQDQPEEIIALYRKLQEGYDVVYGERREKQFSFMKKLSASLFLGVLRRLINEPIVINTTIFRMMTKQVVDEVRKLRERNRYVVGVVGWVGFKHAAQPVEHGKRFSGVTKYRLSHQIALAMNAAVSYSTYAMTIMTRLGLLFVAAAGALGVLIAYRKVVYNVSVMGWSSIALMVLAIGGIQIIILGIIGEYVGRNYMENKDRPLYVVRRIYD